MKALGPIKSMKTTKQTGLSIVLGGLLTLSPLYVNLGGSVLAALVAIVLGVLAISVAVAEAAGSPRFKNHGWPLAAIALAVLITPWILALTGVGQVLGAFSLAALALFAAAAWRIVAPPRSEGFATDGATSEPGPDTKTSAGAEKDVSNPNREAVSQTPVNARSGEESPGKEPADGDNKRRLSSKVESIAKGGKEGQGGGGHDQPTLRDKAEPKASEADGAVAPDMPTQKKSA